MIIPDIENPFFASIARGVADAARQAGYSVVLCDTDNRWEQERHYVGIAVAKYMAGAIVAPTADGNQWLRT